MKVVKIDMLKEKEFSKKQGGVASSAGGA